ncbi:MAG: hypothetical protein M2R45_01228 [Verrucomicrobia subdivision 3 bacterium]|nr:hypothetical protein [Limisphaerales bacterium]MCS1415220.1 hypothetical protein [Limisphaerales bacterium]
MVQTDGHCGEGRVYVNAKDGYGLRVLLEDVKSRVVGITFFPCETKQPRIYIADSSRYLEVLAVAVIGRLDVHDLRRVAERVREDLLEIDDISIVNLAGEKNYEIAIEAGLNRLRPLT